MPAPNPIKQEAKRNGEMFFSDGTACKRGHVAPRRVSNSVCVICEQERYARNYAEFGKIIAEKTKQFYYANHEKAKLSRKIWPKNNTERMAELRYFHCANRRAARIQRTPKWADLVAIKLFYKSCPDGMTVDHIIPLQGKIVSGLHVANNLQYLTNGDNSKKHNRFDPEQVC